VDDLLDTAPCGFLSFGDDGQVSLVDRTLLELLGYAREDVVGGHVERLLPVGSRIFYQTHWFPLLRARRAAERVSAELEIAGEGLRVINEDLLDRTEEAERLRAVAEEANQAKSTFLAVMTHELRTPLNAIAAMSSS
jgi:signal transduction histidine kinase